MSNKRFEAVTTYYDRQARKQIRHVHGIVEAEDVAKAADIARQLYGVKGCSLVGVPFSSFWIDRSVKVKTLEEVAS